MIKRIGRSFIKRTAATALAGALAMGAVWNTVAFAAQEEDTSGETGGRYALELENIASNLIDGISYDVEFATTASGAYFTNAVATGNEIVLEADVNDSTYERTDGSYALVRAIKIGMEIYIYNPSTTDNAAMTAIEEGAYATLDDINAVNIFQKGKKTVARYIVSEGPEVTIGGEEYKYLGSPENIGVKYQDFAKIDEAGARYFGWGTNGNCNYSANLTNARYYDATTNQDLGFYFPASMTSVIQRFGTAGAKITITPKDFGDDSEVSGLTAVDKNGEEVILDAKENSDGSWSFTMPEKAITVGPEYSLGNYARLNIDEDSATYTQVKMDNAFYALSFDYSSSAYFMNKRETAGDINVAYTMTMQSQNVDYFGVARVLSMINPSYPYVGNLWYVPGEGETLENGNTMANIGERTAVTYDAKTHAFNATLNYKPISLVKHSAGDYGEGSGTLAQIDAAGANKIAFAWNEGYYTATLSHFTITDAEGYDLGLAFSPNNRGTGAFSQWMFAAKSEPITLRFTEPMYGDCEFIFTDDDGIRYNVEVTENADGTYSFVMPTENVNLEIVREEDPAKYYATYYEANTKGMLVLASGDSYLKESGTTSDISAFSVNSRGELKLTLDGKEQTGNVTGESILFNGKNYKKLGSYTISFSLAGGKGSTSRITVDSGDYRATRPADPTREGFVFAGWKTSNGEDFSFDEPVTESVTLIAMWEQASAKKGGCGGSVVGGTLALSALFAGAGAVIMAKKSKRK